MTAKKINIAIDGFSSCGKSTVAKLLASDLQYTYVDTGAMYRAVTLYLLNNGLIKDGKVYADEVISSLDDINISFKHNPKRNCSDTYLNGENIENAIRSPKISSLVSGVSKIREIRQKLIANQKEIGKGKGVVMDGRDIGTAVLPHAELKVFLTADIDIRTERRYQELIANGHETSLIDVRENLISRDYQDSHRKENPLVKAKDAVELDNSELTIEELLQSIKDKIA